MSDELTNTIMAGSRHASLSAEALELMGKQAANRFISEGVPLNESISKLAGEHSDVNGEQVKRICEYANTAVYLAKHDQSKTAGANSSYPQFEIADPSRIIQEMSDGARPTVTTNVDLAYSKLPQKSKTASARLIELRETVIDRIFGTDPEKPRADDSYSKDSVIDDLMRAKDSLLSMQDNVKVTSEGYEMSLKEAQAEYYSLVKNHLMEGRDFSEVVLAAQSTGVGKMKIAQAFSPIIERLLTEKVASPGVLRTMTDRLEKIAHRVINPQHPLVSTFSAIIDLSGEVAKHAEACKSIEVELGRVDSFIKENFLAGTSH